MAQPTDFEVFWQSVENVTKKLDRTFCKMLWLSHFRMFTSLTFIETEEDLRGAISAIEKTLKDLKKYKEEEVREIENALNVCIDDDFHLPFAYNIALKGVCKKLSQSENVVDTPCPVESSFADIKNASKEPTIKMNGKPAQDANQQPPLKVQRIQEPCVKIPASVMRPITYSINPPSNPFSMPVSPQTTPGVSPAPSSSEPLPTLPFQMFPLQRRSSVLDKMTKQQIRTFDYEGHFRQKVQISLSTMIPGVVHNTDSFNIIPVSTDFPKSWQVSCPLPDCPGKARVYCRLQNERLCFTIGNLEQHLRTVHGLPKSIDNPAADMNYTEPGSKGFKSVHMSYRGRRNSMPIKFGRKVDPGADDSKFREVIKLRIAKFLHSVPLAQQPSLENLKIKTVSLEFPKSWLVFCPIEGCPGTVKIHCYTRNRSYRMVISNFESHIRRRHQHLEGGEGGEGGEEEDSELAKAIEPAGDESEVQIKLEPEDSPSIEYSSQDLLVEMMSDEHRPALPTNGHATDIKQNDMKRRRSTALERLPRSMSEINEFDFESSVRLRVKRSAFQYTHAEEDDLEDFEVEIVSEEFPKSWQVSCPFKRCNDNISAYCYLKNERLNFALSSIDFHFKKKHGGS